MRSVIFDTPELQATGLQYRKVIDPGVLYVFPYVPEGVVFHSRNVVEPFDIAFLSRDFVVLEALTMFPERDVKRAPQGTYMAVEAKAGTLAGAGFIPGRAVRF